MEPAIDSHSRRLVVLPASLRGSPKCAARPRPHAEEQRSANGSTNAPTASAALRCVSKHEGDAVAVLILRDARTPFDFAETLADARSSG
jgi:hypothetical protein